MFGRNIAVLAVHRKFPNKKVKSFLQEIFLNKKTFLSLPMKTNKTPKTMSIYKEGFHCKSIIENNSKQIFPDAADYGAPTSKGDEIWNAAAQLVNDYGVEGTRQVSRYSTGKSVQVKVKLVDEWAVSDERKTLEQATEFYWVSFVSCTKGLCEGKEGYIWINRFQ